MMNGKRRTTDRKRIIMEKELRIIISGGGTGGHIFPAVSIANAITELRPEAKILFLWEPRGVWRCSGFPMQAIRLSGYR